jgi:hypothetical protein
VLISVEARHLRLPELLSRLEVSEGSEPAARRGAAPPFDPGSRIAREPWRAYAFESGLVQVEATRPRDAAMTVGVIRFPAELLATLRQLDSRRREQGRPHQMIAAELASAMSGFLGSMSTSVRWRLSGEVTDLGISTGSVGLAHTTINTSTGRHVGLHLDSWDRLAPTERGLGSNRMCLNTGFGPRRLLFVPKTSRDLIDELAARGLDVLCDPIAATDSVGRFDLARRYLEVFPDQPVLRLCVLPGEAYVAPTENMIHDGSSEGGIAMDVSVTVRGRFVPV